MKWGVLLIAGGNVCLAALLVVELVVLILVRVHVRVHVLVQQMKK